VADKNTPPGNGAVVPAEDPMTMPGSEMTQ